MFPTGYKSRLTSPASPSQPCSSQPSPNSLDSGAVGSVFLPSPPCYHPASSLPAPAPPHLWAGCPCVTQSSAWAVNYSGSPRGCPFHDPSRGLGGMVERRARAQAESGQVAVREDGRREAECPSRARLILKHQNQVVYTIAGKDHYDSKGTFLLKEWIKFWWEFPRGA